VSDKSSIEWTDATWNPTTGCTKVSPACANCYIERTPPFRVRDRRFVNGHIPLEFHEHRLDAPLKRKKPTLYFVNSLSDLFHPDVPDDFLHRVYHTMEHAAWHTFQLLTKRPERMRDYLKWRYGPDADTPRGRIPSRHIWHGVSVENRHWTRRIDVLRETRSSVRFLSCEPLLEDLGPLDLRGIAWVIVGAESGPRVRPTQPEWIRSVRDQCVAAGVPFFFKQWGGRTAKSGGRILDGRTWDEMPLPAH
jgi:protein gp37